MKIRIRITSVIIAVCIILVTAFPCLGAETAPMPAKQKVTVNDPQFIPLADEQVIAKSVKWYWYALGLGAVAGLAGGGGGGSSSGTSAGDVTVGW
jgi:hypothetical protein